MFEIVSLMYFKKFLLIKKNLIEFLQKKTIKHALKIKLIKFLIILVYFFMINFFFNVVQKQLRGLIIFIS